MKKFVIVLVLAACACQAMAFAGDDDIKAVVQARRARKAKAALVAHARDIKRAKERIADDRATEVMRRRVMENEAHAAQVQHAINGHNANMVQAQANQVQAQRNAILAEQNRALELSRVQCYRCNQFGHYGYGCTR